MKTKILLLASLICLFGFTSCNDSNINTKNENNLQSENPLAGTKWKLVRMEITAMYDDYVEIIDYSKDNVIYDFEFQENYEKLGHYTSPATLVIHNNIPSGFYNDILQESGKYLYQYRQRDDYFYPDGSHTDYGSNFYVGKYGEVDVDSISGFIVGGKGTWCTPIGNYGSNDILNTTDTISFWNSQGTLVIDNKDILWSKILVKIKDGDNK